MKKFVTLLTLLLFTGAFAQAPQAINYQGIARDGLGNAVASQLLGLQLTIHQGSASGTVVYQETFSPSTNQFGLYSVQIGTGTPVTGTFSAINWANSPYFLEVGMDITGGNAYVAAGTSEMISVPYALYAETAGSTVTTSTSEYAYIYNTSAQFVTLGNAVTFDANGPISSGITHAVGSSFIFINTPGIYKIEFSASPSNTCQFSIYQNGVSIAGSRYGSADITQQNHGFVIVNVAAGDVFQLNNTGSSSSLNLIANTGGTLAAVNASLLITKL